VKVTVMGHITGSSILQPGRKQRRAYPISKKIQPISNSTTNLTTAATFGRFADTITRPASIPMNSARTTIKETIPIRHNSKYSLNPGASRDTVPLVIRINATGRRGTSSSEMDI